MTVEQSAYENTEASCSSHLARLILVTFLLTFACARCIVFLIMSRTIPDLYVYVRGIHVHHLNYGILLLSGLSGYLLFKRPSGRKREIASVLYGAAMGLTFDEFGMWIHLGGSYWQRASWDAITVVSAGLALIAFAPAIGRFRPRHWLTGIVLACIVIAFFFMLHRSFACVGRALGPTMQRLGLTAPQ